MSETEHVHEPETDPLLAKLNEPGSKLTEAQFRILRGKYFTVRHHRVKECGHLLDMINEPTFRNCEYCWWAFFSSHGELVQVTDEAFQTHGASFVDKLRGSHYRKMFTRYMSTLAAFKLEAEAMKAAQEKNEHEGGKTEGSGSTWEKDGQGQGGQQNLPTSGEPSQQTDPQRSDEPSIG